MHSSPLLPLQTSPPGKAQSERQSRIYLVAGTDSDQQAQVHAGISGNFGIFLRELPIVAAAPVLLQLPTISLSRLLALGRSSPGQYLGH